MCDRFPRKFDVETSYKQFLRVTYHMIVPLTEELYLLIKPELELHCRLVHRNVTNRKIFKLAFFAFTTTWRSEYSKASYKITFYIVFQHFLPLVERPLVKRPIPTHS